MNDQPTIISRAGLRLVSDRVASWEWESFPRYAQRPRYRQRALAAWQPKRNRRKRPDAPRQGKS